MTHSELHDVLLDLVALDNGMSYEVCRYIDENLWEKLGDDGPISILYYFREHLSP